MLPLDPARPNAAHVSSAEPAVAAAMVGEIISRRLDSA